MAATLGGDSLTVWISDSGRGMLPRLDSPGLGFGLPLMGRLCDDLQFSSDDGAAGTCVTATFVHTRRPATAHRRHEPVAGSGRGEMLRDYLRALRVTSAALQQETEAVLAEASLTLARARRQRRERSQHR